MKQSLLRVIVLLLVLSGTVIQQANAISFSTITKKAVGTALGVYAASAFAGCIAMNFVDQVQPVSDDIGNKCVDICGENIALTFFTLNKLFFIPGAFLGFLASVFVKEENEDITMLSVNGALGLFAAYASYKLLKPVATKQNKNNKGFL